MVLFTATKDSVFYLLAICKIVRLYKDEDFWKEELLFFVNKKFSVDFDKKKKNECMYISL